MPKRAKGRHRRLNTVESEVGRIGCDVPNIQATPKVAYPIERKPTDIETTAIRVADLTDRIGHSRSYLNSLAENTSAERANLARLMLEHGEAVTKLRELALIPQPVV